MDFGSLIHLLAGIVIIWIVLKFKKNNIRRGMHRNSKVNDRSTECGYDDSSEDN